MNRIVDPKLFIKCRLCVDETGQYQIDPNLQKQIKYCFDINVERFDGLPQLLCKNCLYILDQHYNIKKKFLENQKKLNSENVKIDGILQQKQDTVVRTRSSSTKILERFDEKKRKRRRLCSRSNETVVIDEHSGKRSDVKIECIDIEDSDFESETSLRDQTKTFTDESINYIISLCSNRYMNKFNISEGGNTNRVREESPLTGLMRHLEHKNLEVVWSPKDPKIDEVTIMTRSRESSEVDKSKLGWENITSIQNLINQDFALVFEKNFALEDCIDENREEYQGNQLNLLGHESLNQNENRESALMHFQELETKSGGDNSNNDNVSGKMPTCNDTSERKVNDNNTHLRAALDADGNWKKLLNANSVENPKQLSKKKNLPEPASIVQLYSNELKNDSVEPQLEEKTNVIPVQQNLGLFSQTQVIQAIGLNPPGSKQQQKNREYVKLHTAELPNTRTESPFRYFQKLLRCHNLTLLDSIPITLSMQCLEKFQVVFELGSNSSVNLSLLLLCQNNIFCIKAVDQLSNELDIAKLSAHWQWEILKVFKDDDFVLKLLASAYRFGVPIYINTSSFTNLLRSIVFSKDS